MSLKLKFLTTLTSVFLLFSSFSDANEYNWEVEIDKNGLLIETADTDRGFLAFRGTLVMNGEINEMLAILNDIKNHKKWMHQCEDVVIVERVSQDSDMNIRLKQYNDFPFPAENRIAAVHSVTSQNPDSLAITVKLTAEPDLVVDKEEQEDYVIVPYLDGYWLFEPAGKGKTKVTYQVAADPGGSLPKWMVNMLITDLPKKSLLAMSEIADEDREEYVSRDYTKDGLVMPTYE